jgi:hypothetical protein
MIKVKLHGIFEGNKETWCHRADSPRGGFVGDCLSYSFLAKYQNGAVYPVLVLGLTWYKGNAEFVNPVLRDLRKALKRFGCERRDKWTDRTDHRHEIWHYRNNYSANDMVSKFEIIAKSLGWVGQNRRDYWPKDYE